MKGRNIDSLFVHQIRNRRVAERVPGIYPDARSATDNLTATIDPRTAPKIIGTAWDDLRSLSVFMNHM